MNDKKEQSKDPFDDINQDVFNRKNFANQIVSLLHESSIHTIAINADWGMGKTYFVKMLTNKINNTTDYSSTYIDVFANEYANQDVLATILIAVGSLTNNTNLQAFEEFTKGILEIISLEKISIFGVNINIDVLSKKIIAAAKRSSNNQRESIQSDLETLKSNFDKNIADRKLVIIIDELDRCSPRYSLEVLERVKYIFNLKNIKFIFAVNINELKPIIQKAYGNIDAEKYLKKFFQQQFELPFDRSYKSLMVTKKYSVVKENTSNIYNFLKVDFINNDLIEEHKNLDIDKVCILIDDIFNKLQLSPRDINQVFNRFLNILKLIKIKRSNNKKDFNSLIDKAIIILLLIWHYNKEEAFNVVKFGTKNFNFIQFEQNESNFPLPHIKSPDEFNFEEVIPDFINEPSLKDTLALVFNFYNFQCFSDKTIDQNIVNCIDSSNRGIISIYGYGIEYDYRDSFSPFIKNNYEGYGLKYLTDLIDLKT